MEEVQLGSSSPSPPPMGFPPYRRSHLRSQTYRTLVRILSHSYEESHLSGTGQLCFATQDLQIPDNGIRRVWQENQGKESECFELVGSDFLDPKDSAPQKETQVHETIGAQGREFSNNKMGLDEIELMMGIEEVEDSSRRCVEAMSTQDHGFNKEEMLMDELELMVKGTENLACDGDLIALKLELDEKQNGSSKFELMDHQVDHVEFQHSDVNKFGNACDLQVQGELNQHASEGQTSASVLGTSKVKHERQQKEMELVKSVCAAMGSLPTTEENEFEKEENCSQKVSEVMNFSLDQDLNSEALNACKDGRLLDAATLEDKNEILDDEEKSEKSIYVNDETNSFNHLIEKGDIEEGEISGDFGIDSNSFDVSPADALIFQKKEVAEVQKPKNVTENMVLPGNIWNGEKEEGYKSNSFMVSTLQNANNCGEVEPRPIDKNGIVCGVEVAISQETVDCDKAGGCGSVLKAGNIEDRQRASKGATDLPMALANNPLLHRGFLEEDATKDHENSSAVKQKVDVSSKKKRGPVSEEKKAKKKLKKRKKRAEINRQLGVKRLKLHPVQKPKTVAYCRHYLKGRCYEGDKCQFSHDTVPLTKSKPCCHFARHSCMKGDDCPFDHQLSKYPCSNFVSRGSCSRGDACMFSHQAPSKQDIPMPSNLSRPESKRPLLSGNTNLSMPFNNHDCSSFPQNFISNSRGIHSHINTEHEVTDTVQKHPTPAPKGISFINVAKSSLPSLSTLKQGTVTPNKQNLVQIGTHANQSASGKAQNLVETPKKLPAAAPKGINFLSFGKGPVSSFKSSISSFLDRENDIKLLQSDNFGLPEPASPSRNNDYYSKVGDGTMQSVKKIAVFSNEIEKNQSVTEGMHLSFPGKASIDYSTADLQCSLYSHGDQSHSKSAQEGVKAPYISQTSTVTSPLLPVFPFVSRQSSECLASRYHQQASNLGHRALLSTLAFAAEHESDIKMKFSAGASPK